LKILLHMCCAPCSIYPVEVLREEGHELMGYFFRDNIHPYTECEKREEAVRKFSELAGLKVVFPGGYEPEEFLRMVVFREADRCRFCYHQRLKSAAMVARRGKFDAFTSSLLYSRFQNHELIARTGEAVAAETGVPFIYRDFREGWKQGIEQSKAMGLYRQQYCGCIYSEKDRYFRPKKRKRGASADA